MGRCLVALVVPECFCHDGHITRGCPWWQAICTLKCCTNGVRRIQSTCCAADAVYASPALVLEYDQSTLPECHIVEIVCRPPPMGFPSTLNTLVWHGAMGSGIIGCSFMGCDASTSLRQMANVPKFEKFPFGSRALRCRLQLICDIIHPCFFHFECNSFTLCSEQACMHRTHFQ